MPIGGFGERLVHKTAGVQNVAARQALIIACAAFVLCANGLVIISSLPSKRKQPCERGGHLMENVNVAEALKFQSAAGLLTTITQRKNFAGFSAIIATRGWGISLTTLKNFKLR